jgi:hypothetical protein
LDRLQKEKRLTAEVAEDAEGEEVRKGKMRK